MRSISDTRGSDLTYSPRLTEFWKKTPDLNVSLDVLNILFRKLKISKFFSSKNENFVFQSPKVINFPRSISDTIFFKYHFHCILYWFDWCTKIIITENVLTEDLLVSHEKNTIFKLQKCKIRKANNRNRHSNRVFFLACGSLIWFTFKHETPLVSVVISLQN